MTMATARQPVTKASCGVSDLRWALAFVSGPMGHRSAKVTLQKVQLSPCDEGLALSRTNLEIFLRAIVPATASGDPVLVDAEKLAELLGAQPEGDHVEISATHVETGLSFDGVTATMPSYDDEEMPVFPVLNPKKMSATIAGPDLVSALKRVAHCAARESTRYSFNGIAIIPTKTGLKFVATDGRRLAIAESKAVTEKLSQFIVPTSVAKALIALNPQREVEIGVDDSWVRFTAGNTIVVGYLIEGTFPPYEDVVPKQSDTTIRIHAPRLLSAIYRIRPMASDEKPYVRFEISKKTVVLTANSFDAGSATSQIDGGITGRPLTIGINARFACDALAEFGDDEIEIAMNAPNQVFKFTSPNLTVVVMPVNLS